MKEAEYLPAVKIYQQFGIPRNLLRAAAERGDIRFNSCTIDQGTNVLYTYNVDDCLKLVNGEVDG